MVHKPHPEDPLAGTISQTLYDLWQHRAWQMITQICITQPETGEKADPNKTKHSLLKKDNNNNCHVKGASNKLPGHD